jgi:hypothetical protein
MILEELNQLPADSRTLRKFGLTVGGIFLLLTAFLFWRNSPFYHLTLYPGLVLFLPALLYPASLKLAYRGWMALALCMGIVMSTLILTLLYFLVVTPIGLLARLSGKDFMTQRPAASYWRERTKTWVPLDCERQF